MILALQTLFVGLFLGGIMVAEKQYYLNNRDTEIYYHVNRWNIQFRFSITKNY